LNKIGISIKFEKEQFMDIKFTEKDFNDAFYQAIDYIRGKYLEWDNDKWYPDLIQFLYNRLIENYNAQQKFLNSPNRGEIASSAFKKVFSKLEIDDDFCSYKDLGIQIKNSDGSLRSYSDILNDLSIIQDNMIN
jgi:hypothetical protein